MIYIQRVRSNDIGDDYGKQVELGKVFMSHHNWAAGEIPVTITFSAISEAQLNLDGTKLKTSFKVRGDERGGDRIGVDCKEYANQDRICVLKQFLTERLHLTPNEDYFILEDVGNDGRSFKLYGVKAKDIPASIILDKFKGQVIDMEEPIIQDTFLFDLPLQLIYYGAPGSGKSFTIDDVTNENNSVRTTFHPDSDYAGFVGAYKPTMEHVPMSAFVGKEVHVAQPQGEHTGKEKKIVYKYVPQAFLKAYVEAWKRYSEDGGDNPYYLVIEEINRGNCAQIFGDLFQLLDRDNTGSSSYAISADEDIAQFLRDDENGFALKKTEDGKGLTKEQRDVIASFVLKKDNGTEEKIGASILDGSKLLLPPNMRIWATMNTSDQSLFPIDSAFKRRWNWEYMPIDTNPVDKRTGEPLNWRFEIGGKTYYWGEFLDFINPKIDGITQSEDKQMGYFFAKPDKRSEDGTLDIISEKVFVNKVLFNLWTDVFKDYDLTQEPFVRKVKGDDDKEIKKPYKFTDFFPINNNPLLAQFVEGMKLHVIEDTEDNDIKEEQNQEAVEKENTSALRLTIKFPDGKIIQEPTRFQSFIKALEEIGLDKVEPIAAEKIYKRRNAALVSKTKSPEIEEDPVYTYIQSGDYYIVKGTNTRTQRNLLNQISDRLNLGLEVSVE